MACCGRYWDRTSDLFRVKEARYPCANRPHRNLATHGNGTLNRNPVFDDTVHTFVSA